MFIVKLLLMAFSWHRIEFFIAFVLHLLIQLQEAVGSEDPDPEADVTDDGNFLGSDIIGDDEVDPDEDEFLEASEEAAIPVVDADAREDEAAYSSSHDDHAREEVDEDVADASAEGEVVVGHVGERYCSASDSDAFQNATEQIPGMFQSPSKSSKIWAGNFKRPIDRLF